MRYEKLPPSSGAISPTGSSQAQPAATCINQYQEAPGVTAASLIATNFEIKAGWPGGLWLQKGRETFLCNTGRVPDNEPICWTLREPVKAGAILSYADVALDEASEAVTIRRAMEAMGY